MLFKGTFNYYGENIILWTHAKSVKVAFHIFVKKLSFQLDRPRALIGNYFLSGKDNYLIEQKVKETQMKPTWKVIKDELHNCECLICKRKFSFYGVDFFNMTQVTCPTCKQKLWVPECPNGCKPFIEEDEDEEALYAKHDNNLSRIKHFMRS